jgi:hypothetical protein
MRILVPHSRRSQPAARGQEATFTDASRVFVLNVPFREGHQALPGQLQPLEVQFGPPESRQSRLNSPRSERVSFNTEVKGLNHPERLGRRYTCRLLRQF